MGMTRSREARRRNSATVNSPPCQRASTESPGAVGPWRIDGELAGYIELGIDVEGLALHLKEILGGELLVVIEKSYLQRGDW